MDLTYSSEKLGRIAPSASVEAAQKATDLKAQGLDVISLAAGEPDFPTPPHVVAAAIASIHAGDTKYTDVRGTKELRAAVAAKFKRDNGLDYTADDIIVGPGAKNLIATALTASVNPGDEVIIPAPAWVSYVDLTKLADGVPVVVETKRQFGLKLDPETLEEAITDKTRWLFLNSPGNPTGAVYSREELEALGKVLEKHPHVMVLTDEIYEYLLFDGVKFVSFVEACPGMKDRTLTLNGASKGFAMTGWRIGFAGGPGGLIKAMGKVMGQMVGSSCTTSQAATVAALEGPQDYIAERAAAYEARRDRVLELLAPVPGLAAQKPQGAFYLYVDCGGILGKVSARGKVLATDSDVVDWLLEEALVATVTGAAYGLSPYFRISIASALPVLEEACGRIATAVATLKDPA